LKITLVIELLDRFVGRIAVGEVVGELERADARLDCLQFVLVCSHDFVSSNSRRMCFVNTG
jgi:hypothetical protein